MNRKIIIYIIVFVLITVGLVFHNFSNENKWLLIPTAILITCPAVIGWYKIIDFISPPCTHKRKVPQYGKDYCTDCKKLIKK